MRRTMQESLPLLGRSMRAWRHSRSHFPLHNHTPAVQSSRANSTTTTSFQPPPRTSFEGYYADLLDAPLYSLSSATRTPATPPPPDNLPTTIAEEVLAKARVVFGSRLAGPGERAAAIASASTNIAGVLVPPRPDEPDNCCMSGCVNCVWDRYRDELEEWADKSTEARRRLASSGNGEKGLRRGEGLGSVHAQGAASMDDDGGGSQVNWSGMDQDTPEKDLFEGIPVGIREFMKTEKLLKARHHRERKEGG